MNYKEFLKTKKTGIHSFGFEVKSEDLNNNLFPFQKHIIKRAVRNGKYAIFADCGLGKTFMQIEWARVISEKENAKVLILAPLAVSGQTIQEGKRWGIRVGRIGSDCKIQITNYEQLKNIDVFNL